MDVIKFNFNVSLEPTEQKGIYMFTAPIDGTYSVAGTLITLKAGETVYKVLSSEDEIRLV